MNQAPPETPLIAGPPAANPPLLLAILVILAGLAGPYLFAAAGAPSLLLGTAAAALAIAGIITLFGAIAAQKRRRADPSQRQRAALSTSGITFFPNQTSSSTQFFALEHIKAVHLLPRALLIETTETHPKPGRHRLVFGKLSTPRDHLLTAIAAIHDQISGGQINSQP